MSKLIHEELSGKIIGAAMDVLNELKPGLDEKLYETGDDQSNCNAAGTLFQCKARFRFFITPN